MSERRTTLVCYDIRNPKRLRQVHKTMKAHGEPLQYSVFLCELDRMQRENLLARLQPQIDSTVDCVLLIDLGAITGRMSERIQHLGKRPKDPHRGPRIL